MICLKQTARAIVALEPKTNRKVIMNNSESDIMLSRVLVLLERLTVLITEDMQERSINMLRELEPVKRLWRCGAVNVFGERHANFHRLGNELGILLRQKKKRDNCTKIKGLVRLFIQKNDWEWCKKKIDVSYELQQIFGTSLDEDKNGEINIHNCYEYDQIQIMSIGIPTRYVNSLINNNISTVRGLRMRTSYELQSLRNFSKFGLKICREKLTALGVNLDHWD